MSNLTVREANENAFKCWKEEKMGFVWNIMLDAKQIAVKADLML